MDFISEYFYVLTGTAILLLIISTARMFGRPSKNDDRRKQHIKTTVENSGGKVIDISKMSRSECPYNEELGLNQDVVFVPYKVEYEFEDTTNVGWAILVLTGVPLNYVVADSKWIMKF